MNKKKINLEDLAKYEDITKDYNNLKFKSNTQKKMKIRYNNPDDIDKVLEIESTDEDTIFVRVKELNIESKSGEFIRLTFNIPSTKCNYSPCVIVKNKTSKQIEEILRFNITVAE